jgi:multidrug efflux pump subunit AcrA (membrane-fusion protein)
MSFIGKIMLVFQLVLSVVFMAFAAAVYNTHMSWREEANKQKQSATKAAAEKNDAAVESSKRETALTEERNEALNRAQTAEAANALLTTEVNDLKRQKADLQQSLATAQQRAQIAAEEASARTEEARQLRELNHDQTIRLDKAAAERTVFEDRIRQRDVELAAAGQKNKELLAQIARFHGLLSAHGISADEAVELADRQSPAPRVEGIIEAVKRPTKLGNAELVEFSVGSDDGLKKGHELTVWRSGLKSGGKGKYLARIRIISTTPDRSVGEVIETTRNGAIQEGDNVSTKL